MSYSLYRRPIRHLEYAVAAGYTMLQLVKEGKDLTFEKSAKAGAWLSLQLAAIYYTDKAIAAFLTRGYVAVATKTLLGVQAAYIGGAVASVAIDSEEGLSNYNDWIDDVTSGDITGVSQKTHFTILVLITKFSQTTEGQQATSLADLIVATVNPF